MQQQPEAKPVASFTVGSLSVKIFENRREAGMAAAAEAASDTIELARAEGQLAAVFASAPSQVELLASLVGWPGLPWGSITAFHLDEYVGIDNEAPRSFARFLREHLFDRVPVAQVHYLDGTAEPEAEQYRYESLLREQPLGIACIGIGENGHIAFNEPDDTDFEDERLVRLVQLDETSRCQQVNEGLFPSLEEVPMRALTLTVPAISSARRIHCIVPGRSKAYAVERTLQGPVGEGCPATSLRSHPRATLYLDRESAANLELSGLS